MPTWHGQLQAEVKLLVCPSCAEGVFYEVCRKGVAPWLPKPSRIGAKPELRHWLKDAQVPLGFLGDAGLQSLRLSEERGHALVAGHLGVEGVTVARVSGVEGMVEDAHQVVVLIPRGC